MSTSRVKPLEYQQGDTLVTVDCTCERKNSSNVLAALDMSTGSWTVTFTMINAATGTAKVSAASATIVTPASGLVRYTFSESDVDTPGKYWGIFRVSTGGAEASFPVDPTDLEIWIHGNGGTTAQAAYEAAV